MADPEPLRWRVTEPDWVGRQDCPHLRITHGLYGNSDEAEHKDVQTMEHFTCWDCGRRINRVVEHSPPAWPKEDRG